MSDDLRDVLDDAADAIRSKLPPHTYTGGKNCLSSPKCERCRLQKIIDRLEAEDGGETSRGFPPFARSRARVSCDDMYGEEYGATPTALLLRKREAATLLRLSLRSVDRLISTGELPRVRLGGSVRFRLEDVLSLVEKSREEPRA